MREQLLLTLFLLGGAGTSPAQWLAQQAGTSSNIWSVCFMSRDAGWAVYNDSVLRSTDGGSLWTASRPGIKGSFALINVMFTNLQKGWVCGIGDSGSVIARTTDGGDSWIDVSPKLGASIHGVYFVDARNGWGFGDSAYSGLVIRTTDGGLTWRKQDVGVVSYNLSGYFVDTLVGWAVGDYVILGTTNGGEVWTQQDSAFAHSPLGTTFRSAYFANRDTGWIVGGLAGSAIIAATTDGGVSWTHTAFPTLSMDVGQLDWVQFVDDTTGWAVGWKSALIGGAIISTTDGGKTWIQQGAQNAKPLHSVSFADRRFGWGVGDEGTILATTDGGVTFVSPTGGLPAGYTLHQNFPNPFNPSTTIRYELPHASRVSLKVYNTLGQEVATLVNETKPAGVFTATFDAGSLASGVYFYRMQAGNFVEVKKLIVLR